MWEADNFYSRFVGWSKIILPLAALALLSTLFLFAKGKGGETDLPYAEIEEIARETRLSEPNFAGVNPNGAVYELRANMARPMPENANILEIERIAANLTTIDGLRIEMSAGRGIANAAAKTVTLNNLARLSTSDGYLMETAGLSADFDAGRVESLGPLEVRAPFGSLTAGQMVIDQGLADQGTQMIFKQGVRLVYQPK
ncbi:MAG: hypothetical protein EBT13_06810 [Rhodobacteraceae bacterium]|nr:hypothetical protein [Paracoccaceae bacterium]